MSHRPLRQRHHSVAFSARPQADAHLDGERGIRCLLEGSRGRIHHQARLPDGTARAAVVLLHGTGEHLGLYDGLAGRFSANGYAVHALDCVGHGLSEGERGRVDSWDDYVNDARRLVRIATDQHPGGPIILVGHSGGAAAAYLLAARHPYLASAAVLSGAPLAPLDWAAAGRVPQERLGLHWSPRLVR